MAVENVVLEAISVITNIGEKTMLTLSDILLKALEGLADNVSQKHYRALLNGDENCFCFSSFTEAKNFEERLKDAGLHPFTAGIYGKGWVFVTQDEIEKAQRYYDKYQMELNTGIQVDMSTLDKYANGNVYQMTLGDLEASYMLEKMANAGLLHATQSKSDGEMTISYAFKDAKTVDYLLASMSCDLNNDSIRKIYEKQFNWREQYSAEIKNMLLTGKDLNGHKVPVGTTIADGFGASIVFKNDSFIKTKYHPTIRVDFTNKEKIGQILDSWNGSEEVKEMLRNEDQEALDKLDGEVFIDKYGKELRILPDSVEFTVPDESVEVKFNEKDEKKHLAKVNSIILEILHNNTENQTNAPIILSQKDANLLHSMDYEKKVEFLLERQASGRNEFGLDIPARPILSQDDLAIVCRQTNFLEFLGYPNTALNQEEFRTFETRDLMRNFGLTGEEVSKNLQIEDMSEDMLEKIRDTFDTYRGTPMTTQDKATAMAAEPIFEDLSVAEQTGHEYPVEDRFSAEAWNRQAREGTL